MSYLEEYLKACDELYKYFFEYCKEAVDLCETAFQRKLNDGELSLIVNFSALYFLKKCVSLDVKGKQERKCKKSK